MFRDFHLFIHLLGSVDLHFGLVIYRNLDENRDREYRGGIFPRLLSGPVDQGGIFCVIKIEKKKKRIQQVLEQSSFPVPIA